MFVIGFLLLLNYAERGSSYHDADYFIGHATHGFAEQWSYLGNTGPEFWPILPLKNNECGGDRQSPINVDTNYVQYTSTHIHFKGHNLVYLNSSLFNNGHNVNLTINKYYLDRPRLNVVTSKGKLKRYIFDSLHYHFGDVSDHGSEHQINHRKFPMEMHSVYFKEKYGRFQAALESGASDALAIVAVLFDWSPYYNNPRLAAITNQLAEVSFPDVLATVPRVVLSDLFPQDTSHFFTYVGSLTTPPCTQVATWYILKQRYPVSEIQLQQFRRLTKKSNEDSSDLNVVNGRSGYLADNVRPVQPINRRTVFMHY